jgi:uncharacterized OB-fold protein
MTHREKNGENSPKKTRAGSTTAPVTVHVCGGGHAFFFAHEACPRCQKPLAAREIPAEGVLVSHTTVRVGPTGKPFRLGLARVACGAQTLCILDGQTGEDPGTELVIERRRGLYHASARSS